MFFLSKIKFKSQILININMQTPRLQRLPDCLCMSAYYLDAIHIFQIGRLSMKTWM